MADPLGHALGHYRILEKLGEGGMGVVYRAHDERLDRDVAIKVLPASLGQEPERLRRFEQEARAAGALNHPNILAIHELGSHEGTPFIVTELLQGQTLRDLIRDRRLTPSKSVEYAVLIARGLAAAHVKGITHRDLKPANLFVLVAMAYTGIGDTDRAIEWLERAYEARDTHMAHLKVNPINDPLRDDPRFQDLLRRMNFPKG